MPNYGHPGLRLVVASRLFAGVPRAAARGRGHDLMGSKGPVIIKLSGDPILCGGGRSETRKAEFEQESFPELQSNIEETFAEIETLRGSLQYWEGRRPASDPKERALLAETFRVLHGELLGLTARARQLMEAADTADEG